MTIYRHAFGEQLDVPGLVTQTMTRDSQTHWMCRWWEAKISPLFLHLGNPNGQTVDTADLRMGKYIFFLVHSFHFLDTRPRAYTHVHR
jgi:hypothetical protein